MGEMVVSAAPTDELVALGLGSCIGLAIVDQTAGVAGLAHIVLPESHGEATPQPGKFADTAVPELLTQLRRAGAVDRRMTVVLVGGARMFEMSGSLDIGARNEQAVTDELRRERLSPKVVQTGGNQGRTVKVEVGTGSITMRIAGESPVTLVEGSAPDFAPSASPPTASRPGATRVTSGPHGRVAPRHGHNAGGAGGSGGLRGRSTLRVGGSS